VSVERERKCDQLVIVAERVEFVSELDRHDLGTATVRPRHHVRDAHPVMLARSVKRPVNGERRRPERIVTLSAL
jgi:hypothetical protein